MTAPTDPIAQALTAYGISPDRTPRDIYIEWTPEGITIDQFIEHPMHPGDTAHLLLNEDGDDLRVERRFFPHPTGE